MIFAQPNGCWFRAVEGVVGSGWGKERAGEIFHYCGGGACDRIVMESNTLV